MAKRQKPHTPFLIALACAALVLASVAKPASAPLRISVFARAGVSLDDILWTGSHFLYVQNTKNTLWSAPAAGVPLTRVAGMPDLVEETRCVLSPGTHGFAPGVIFCHSPDNKIYELSLDGRHQSLFATLPAPYPPAADGALTFDDVGHFGHVLIAATGRSGAAKPAGGVVYTIDSSGHVRELGGYHGPGGADELAMAPARFGSAAGDALLTVDAGRSGTVVAMAPDGHTRVLASLPVGPNPIVAIPPAGTPSGGGIAAGVYVTDDLTDDVYFSPAAGFTAYAGDVLVGGEAKPLFWILEPKGNSFALIALPTRFRAPRYSLENGIYVP